LSIGANTFQFFTRNPRGGKAKDIDPADVRSFLDLARTHNFGVILAHAPYTLNACSANPKIRTFTAEILADDLERMEAVPGNLYNFHPGSHTGQGVDAGCAQIAGLLNSILKPEQTTAVLLETMAGKGTEVGGTFEELGKIISEVAVREKIGVCLDTCHIFDGGYDIVNALDDVLERFDRDIGLGMLRAVHLNDSLNPLGSRKDRHAKIGKGHIGLTRKSSSNSRAASDTRKSGKAISGLLPWIAYLTTRTSVAFRSFWKLPTNCRAMPKKSA
jgi:deoxyribonuclease-4